MNHDKLIESRLKIGHLLRNKRINLNMTISELSRKSKLTRATIYSIENATSSYNIDSYIIYLASLELSK